MVSKKRQRTEDASPQTAAGDEQQPSTSGRHYTLSMAVPGSIIDNTQNLEFATFVAGQIARTAAIFNVDELVIVDDTPHKDTTTVSAGAAFLARVAQFMETPQYLKKALIPMHPDLRLAGLLPPLDAPHHLRNTEWKQYREGVVLRNEPSKGSFIDIGLDRTAFVKDVIPVGTRVTLYVKDAMEVKFMEEYGESMILGKVVPPSAPRLQHGMYWGYTTRLAHGISGLLKGGPHKYDLTLGTSEHGESAPCDALQLPRFKHLLVAFGGLQGLEECITADERTAAKQPQEVFDMYLNTCPDQGSRTIRTEEAVLISMAYLQPAIAKFAHRK